MTRARAVPGFHMRTLPADKPGVRLICFGLLLALAVPALHAQDFVERAPKQTWSKRKLVRRLTLAAACAGSLAFDTLTTRRAMAAGAVEANGLLAGAQGNPAWGRLIGAKAGFCGAVAVIEETHTFGLWNTPKSDWSWTAVNAGTAGYYTWVGFHNLQLASSLAAPK